MVYSNVLISIDKKGVIASGLVALERVLAKGYDFSL